MRNPDTTIFIERQHGREIYYTLIATPTSLHHFVESLSTALAALPTPLPDARRLSLDGLAVAGADGSRKEVYLSVRAEPSFPWLKARRRRTVKTELVAIVLLVAWVGFAIYGFGMFSQWLSAHAFKWIHTHAA